MDLTRTAGANITCVRRKYHSPQANITVKDSQSESFTPRKGVVRITKKGILIICSILIAAILAGTLPQVLLPDPEEERLAENRRMRETLSSVLPPEVVRENVEGFELQVLCDTDAAPAFAAGELSDALSEKAAKRNEHLIVETGVQLSVSATADFAQTAKEDILSGELRYNLYAGDAAGSLSALLSAGHLSDLSDSAHIRADKPWFDGAIMDELSIFGGKYLISSATADARSGAAVVTYNRSIELQNNLLPEDERSLAAIALDGQFTIETLLAASRAAQAVSAEQYAEAHLEAANSFHGFCYGEEDIFPLYFGAGGSFVTADEEDTLTVTPLSTMRKALDAVKPLTADPSALADPDAFGELSALFSVHKLSEIGALREAVMGIGILPLPKASEEAEYRSYIDLAHTTMLAIPRGIEEQGKVEYLIARMAFLSYGYMEPLLKEQVAAGNADDERMLSLIADSVACDVSALFGYGDIAGLLADTVREGDDRLALHYYNRKTLYEKALSIIEKRLKSVESQDFRLE